MAPVVGLGGMALAGLIAYLIVLRYGCAHAELKRRGVPLDHRVDRTESTLGLVADTRATDRVVTPRAGVALSLPGCHEWQVPPFVTLAAGVRGGDRGQVTAAPPKWWAFHRMDTPARIWTGQPSPHVSMILTTRDRPQFLKIALRCYAQQTYANRELIVVDDGAAWPVSPEAVASAGGRLIRMAPGTPLGTKLHCGIAESTGGLCQKMDDDAWYGPGFLRHMVGAWQERQRNRSWPIVVGSAPHLVFDLSRWEIRSTQGHGMASGTLLVSRHLWEESFHHVVKDEDSWCILDHLRPGTRLAHVDGKSHFLQVRHGSSGIGRGQTRYVRFKDTVGESVKRLRSFKQPDAILLERDLAAYREIRGTLFLPAEASRRAAVPSWRSMRSSSSPVRF